MVRLSIKYWLKHKKRLFSIWLSLLFGVSGLMCAVLFTRTANLLKYENLLEAWGAYNYLIPEVSLNEYEEYKTSDLFEKAGIIKVGGMCQGKAGNSFVSGSLDSSGEELYHYSCRDGDYPREEDEIAASRKVLEALGITPRIDEKVELALYDEERHLVEKRMFRVSGVLKTLNTERNFTDPELDVSVPQIFFDNQYFEKLHIGKNYVMVRENEEYTFDDIQRYAAEGGHECSNMPMYFMAQQMMLNIDTYDELSYNGVQNMIDNTGKDFDSTILIPLFSIMVSVIIFVSIFSGMCAVLNERKNQMELYRCLGMTKFRAEVIVFCETFIIVILGLLLGLLSGYGLYFFMHEIGCRVLGMNLPLVLTVDPLIDKITLNPFQFPLLICGVTSVFSFVIALINWKDGMVSEDARRFRRHTFSSRITKSRCVRKMFFSDRAGTACIFLSVFIIMASGFFGILYFLERTNREYEKIQEPLQEYDMGDIDYLSEKDFNISNCALGQANRHAGGISIEKINQLSALSEIETIHYCIQAKSTKVFLNQENENLRMALYDLGLKNNAVEGDGMDELYEKTLQEQGYIKGEELFNIATVGVNEDMINKLEPYVREGKLELSALKAGEQIVIVSGSGENGPYHAGDVISMTDVVISEPEIEAYDFSSGAIPDNRKESFTYEYDGEKVKGYAFGKRVDYSVTVGAVVNVEDFELANYYLSDSLVGEGEFNFLCEQTAFSNWGLPDRNATLVGVKVNSFAEDDVFSKKWHEIIGGCSDITTVSTFDIKNDMRDSRISYWSVLWLMLILLLLIGGVTISNSIHRIINLKNKDIGRLMCFGVTLRELRFSIVRYLVKGILLVSALAWIPAKCFDAVCVNYREQYEELLSDATGLVKIFPYYYHIFERNFVLIYIAIILFMILLSGIVVIAVTRKIKNQSVVDMIGNSQY